ncbi:hypothetical protein C7381_102161 [Ezakiella coagulans]|uniref:Uncharacterized protein n=1 Tax=Ezakiella coagulans TaxID=46507 RepID=A0A2U1E5Z0_9FIRM|nr:hypothetical protein [Ezakiella coagulans]PVY95272.1 hypothetical protein C7381_102161 [Ezakiella coagulans]
MKKIYKMALVFLSLLLLQTLTVGAGEKKMKNTIIGDSIVSRADGEYRIFLNSNKDTANFYSFKNLLNLNLITKIQFSPSQETKDGDSFALKSNRHVKNIWIKAEPALDKSPIFYTKPTTDMKNDFYYIESSFWDSIFGKRQLPNFIELGWNYYEK